MISAFSLAMMMVVVVSEISERGIELVIHLRARHTSTHDKRRRHQQRPSKTVRQADIMEFPVLSFRSNEEPHDPPGSLDSITLGQLKSMVGTQPKAKTSQYAMRYEDEDTVFNEIEEFYSYVEVPQVAENLKAWQGSFQGGKYATSYLCDTAR